MRLIAILFAALMTLPVFAAEKEKPSATLVELVRSVTDSDSLEDLLHPPEGGGSPLIPAALAAPPAAAVKIAPLLEHGNKYRQQAALQALAFLGGDPALAALRRHYDRTRSIDARVWLCFALAARGSPADRAFLVEALHDEKTGDDDDNARYKQWDVRKMAAFSLGVLHDREATGALKAAARQKNEYAAAEALRWIEQGPWTVHIPDPKSPRDQAIAAVLRNGLPRTAESPRFFQEKPHGFWQFTDQAWRFEATEHPKIPQPDELKDFGDHIGVDVQVLEVYKVGQYAIHAYDPPLIYFVVRFNPQGTRALVSVGLTFGPLNGNGYDYLLRKDGNDWKVVGLRSTWIA